METAFRVKRDDIGKVPPLSIANRHFEKGSCTAVRNQREERKIIALLPYPWPSHSLRIFIASSFRLRVGISASPEN
jgi:hypothetical protein